MENINDIETIKELENLKKLVDSLLKQSKNRLEIAEEIQNKSELLKQDLYKLESVYESINSMGNISDFIFLVDRIKKTEDFLEVREEKYKNLDVQIEEGLHSLKNLLTEKDNIINDLQQELLLLREKRQKIEEYYQVIQEEYQFLKNKQYNEKTIVNNQINTDDLSFILEEINDYKNQLLSLTNLPTMMKEMQYNYQEKVNQSINEGMNMIQKKQLQMIDRQNQLTESVQQLVDENKNHKLKIKNVEHHLKTIYDYLKLKPWQNSSENKH